MVRKLFSRRKLDVAEIHLEKLTEPELGLDFFVKDSRLCNRSLDDDDEEDVEKIA